MARITWKTGKYDGANGTVGKLSLFSISWKTRREDPKYTLRTTLQGFAGQQWQDDDPKVLEARAERVLVAFVTELGAAFPAETETEDA